MSQEETPEPRQPGSPSHLIVLSVVLVVVLLAAGFGGFKLLEAMKEPPAVGATPPVRTAVRVIRAERVTHLETITGYGRARALRETSVAAEVPGTVLSLADRLEAGVAVKQGEELVRLDDRDAAAALAAADARIAEGRSNQARAANDTKSLAAQIAAARREFDTAEREFDRLRSLVPRAASESDVDRQRGVKALREQAVLALEGRQRAAESDAKRADAEVAAATADRVRAANDLERTRIAAPYDAVISVRHVQIGQRVTPGTVLFDLVDLTRIEVPISLPASRHADVVPGAAASVRAREEGGVLWTGTAVRVSPTVDPRQRTFVAYLEVHGDGGRAPVAPGAFVVAEIAGRTTADVFVVPREAFVGETLYVAESDGDEALIHLRHPTVERWLPDVALVSGGLEPGEQIVVTSLEQVADGGRVRIVSEAASGTDSDR